MTSRIEKSGSQVGTDFMCPYCGKPIEECGHLIYKTALQGDSGGVLADWIHKAQHDVDDIAAEIPLRSIALSLCTTSDLIQQYHDGLYDWFVSQYPDQVHQDYFSAILTYLKSHGYDHKAQQLCKHWNYGSSV